jgi:hypothetical protein
MFNGCALIIAVALSIQRSPSIHWQRIKNAFRRRTGGTGGAGGEADLPDDELSEAGAIASSHHSGTGPH